MIEIPIALMLVLAFAAVTGCLLAILYAAIAKIERNSAAFWKRQYEQINAQLRPEFQAAVDNLVPRTTSATKRIDRLRKALEVASDEYARETNV